MMLAVQLGSPLAAAEPTMEQLGLLAGYLEGNDIEALRAYVLLHPELLDERSQLALLLRRFMKESVNVAKYLGFEPDLRDALEGAATRQTVASCAPPEGCPQEVAPPPTTPATPAAAPTLLGTPPVVDTVPVVATPPGANPSDAPSPGATPPDATTADDESTDPQAGSPEVLAQGAGSPAPGAQAVSPAAPAGDAIY